MTKITFEDFQKLDIRIGTVIEAEVPEWSHWVMKLNVDFGKEIGKKTAFAGIMKFFKPEDLIGKQFPFIINLEPKKIGPKENGKQNISECMMIMAVPKDDEETPPVMFSLERKVPNGIRVH
ncbi:tRNA-binding protein [Patescibacteria group bacterium]|nr:tRNA-binding protein [Patescibacteria group bacterium]MBU0777421.1 tRNA-binding protein [Patescibacteria group bacterium]MBU0846057.1 tRNA-binding protein [Patescibacteria group bacterium]MBU0922443.1 tRNA-binding protein [Patescibacteria group bacterium]MBU1066824.1 tRNA-binding protein [Patescibacteria group bacterium]